MATGGIVVGGTGRCWRFAFQVPGFSGDVMGYDTKNRERLARVSRGNSVPNCW